MTNRFKNRRQNTIPKKILPPDAVRVTKADKTRVWLIGGLEFDSKADYFQYLLDKALAEKAEVKVTVNDAETVISPTLGDAAGGTDGFTGKTITAKSATDD